MLNNTFYKAIKNIVRNTCLNHIHIISFFPHLSYLFPFSFLPL